MDLRLAAEYGAEALAEMIAQTREGYEPWVDEEICKGFMRRLRRLYRAERALTKLANGGALPS